MKALKHQPPIQPHDWSFDSIPDHHLIACCHWEYARESAFLREFKSRCVETNRNPKPLDEAFELCGKDARLILSIGTVADSFLLGFGLEPLSPPTHNGKPNNSPAPPGSRWSNGTTPAAKPAKSSTNSSLSSHPPTTP